MTRSSLPRTVAAHAVLILYTVIALFPVLVIVINSMKSRNAIFRSPLSLPNAETFDLVGYTTVLAQGDFIHYFQNSLVVTVASLFFVLLFGRRRWWLAILLCGVISCAIEISQGALLPTRVSDLDDVVANTSGGTVGVLFGVVLMSISLARRGRRERVRAKPAQALG